MLLSTPGLDLMLTDLKGNTCLHYACQQTTEKIAGSLLKANAEIQDRARATKLVKVKNKQGET